MGSETKALSLFTAGIIIAKFTLIKLVSRNYIHPLHDWMNGRRNRWMGELTLSFTLLRELFVTFG